MTDVWTDTTLNDLFGDALGGIAKFMTDSQGILNQDLVKLNATLTSLQNRITATQSFLATANSFLNALGASGFYTIILQPEANGNWSTRLTTAVGAPDQNPLSASAGICVIIKGPNVPAILTRFTQLMTILTTPIKW